MESPLEKTAKAHLPADVVLVVRAHAAGVVEQRAGERRRLPAVRAVAAQLQRLLPVDHGVGTDGGGGGEARTVRAHCWFGDIEGRRRRRRRQ